MRIVAVCFFAVALFPVVACADDLKFDEVKLVEGKKGDIPLLYVVLTRAVSVLTVLHARPLPAQLSAPVRD